MNISTKIAKTVAKALTRTILLLFALSSASALAQVPVALSPVARQQFFSASGLPLAGGCVSTYNAGTTTPAATYVDIGGVNQNTNPITLDGGGFATIYLANQAYKIQVNAAPATGACSSINLGGLIWTQDNVSAYQIINSVTNLFFVGVTSDPSGVAGELGYRSDIPCFRGFTTLWDCFVMNNLAATLTNKTLTSPTITSPIISTPVLNGQSTGTGIQGTDSKLLTAGTIGSAGAPLCVDGVGGATTLGCTVPLDADQTNLTANVAATPIGGAITANGFYRFSCFVIDTQAATTSSTLPACSFTFTLADTSQVASVPVCASVTTNTLGDTCQIAGVNFANYAYIKNGSFIKYQTTGYASVGATPLAYAVHARLEGPF